MELVISSPNLQLCALSEEKSEPIAASVPVPTCPESASGMQHRIDAKEKNRYVGVNNYQYDFEVYLMYLKLKLHQESGTTILGIWNHNN